MPRGPQPPPGREAAADVRLPGLTHRGLGPPARRGTEPGLHASIIIYQAGVPIRVPVFFDEVALRYQGLEGLSLESSFRFPTPELSPSTIGPNWFQLPPYLGGAMLGKKEALAPLRVWPSMASLLNWAKTLDIEQLVAAIPQDVRVGSVDVRFVGLDIAVHWALTTLAELRRQPDLLPGGRVVSVEGSLVPQGTKGVVAVLGGSVAVGQR